MRCRSGQGRLRRPALTYPLSSPFRVTAPPRSQKPGTTGSVGRSLGTCPLNLFVFLCFHTRRRLCCVLQRPWGHGPAPRGAQPGYALGPAVAGDLLDPICSGGGTPAPGYVPNRAAAVSDTPRSLRSTPGVGGRDSQSQVLVLRLVLFRFPYFFLCLCLYPFRLSFSFSFSFSCPCFFSFS